MQKILIACVREIINLSDGTKCFLKKKSTLYYIDTNLNQTILN